jgi:hypothetical protein
MIRGTVTIGRLFGVAIGLYVSWFVIAGLLTVSLAANLHTVNPEWPRVLIWTVAGATALAFFAALVLHELAHAMVARAPVTQALDAIGREDMNQLPVLEHGRLRGIISRDHILRLLSARAELKM